MCILQGMGEMNLIYKSKAPVVADRLSQDIVGGKYQPGSCLPADDALARDYDVSRVTMRKVLSILADHGRVVRVPRKGTMVPTAPAVPASESAASVAKADRASPASRTSGSGGVSAPAVIRAKTTLAMIRTGTIDHLNTEWSEGLRRYGEQHGLRVQIHATEQGHDAVLQMLGEVENFADGVYVYPFDAPGYVESLNRLVRMEFPVVASRPLAGVNMSVVCSDNSAGAMQATNYLLMKYRRPV